MSGGTVALSRKNFYLAGDVDITTGNVHLLGQGRETILNLAANVNGIHISNAAKYCMVGYMFIDGCGEGGTTGLFVEHTIGSYFPFLHFYRCRSYGIDMRFDHTNLFLHPQVDNCGTAVGPAGGGIRIGSQTQAANATTIIGGELNYNNRAALEMCYGYGIRIWGTTIEGNKDHGILQNQPSQNKVIIPSFRDLIFESNGANLAANLYDMDLSNTYMPLVETCWFIDTPGRMKYNIYAPASCTQLIAIQNYNNASEAFLNSGGQIIIGGNLTLSSDLAAVEGLWLAVPATMDITHAHRIARGTYDFSVDGGSGTIGLHVKIPDNAIVVKAWYEVLTQLTSGGAATIALGIPTDDADGILPATAVAGWTLGSHDATPDGTAANFTTKTTAGRIISMTIATADLTAGKFVLWCEYVVSD